MTSRNFEKARRFGNMSKRGYEPSAGSNLAPSLRRPSKSKAAQSTEAAGMISPSTMITKLITCKCGHKGKVRIPMAKVDGPFRCVKCHQRIQ